MLPKVLGYTLSRDHSYFLDPATQVVSIIHCLLWLLCSLHILPNQTIRLCSDLHQWLFAILLHVSTPVTQYLLIALLRSCLLLIRLILTVEAIILRIVSIFFFFLSFTQLTTTLTDDTKCIWHLKLLFSFDIRHQFHLHRF